ncbi:hypothetical protein Tco_0223518 [Tanacetum coccineum]
MDDTNSPPPPEVPTSILGEKVLKLNLILESLNLIPSSHCSRVFCKKEKDSDVMLIKLIKDKDCPNNEELDEDDDIKTNPIEHRKYPKSPSGLSNFTRRVRGMPIFVGNFIYASDFMIVEDFSSIIDPRMSSVVLEKHFVELSNMTYDLSSRVVKFTNGIEEIAYKMPHKIDQYDSLSDMEKENTKSVYFRNEEDKRKGV